MSFLETLLEYIAEFLERMKWRKGLLRGALMIIVMLVLVKLAFNFFNENRIEAQVAMARTDFANALRQIQSEIYSRNIPIEEGVTPLKYKSWGEWIIDIAGLDKKRWIATEFGIRTTAKWQNSALECKGDYFYIDTKEGKLIFAPSKITNEVAFCKALKDSYKNKDSEINLRAYSTIY